MPHCWQKPLSDSLLQTTLIVIVETITRTLVIALSHQNSCWAHDWRFAVFVVKQSVGGSDFDQLRRSVCWSGENSVSKIGNWKCAKDRYWIVTGRPFTKLSPPVLTKKCNNCVLINNNYSDRVLRPNAKNEDRF